MLSEGHPGSLVSNVLLISLSSRLTLVKILCRQPFGTIAFSNKYLCSKKEKKYFKKKYIKKNKNNEHNKYEFEKKTRVIFKMYLVFFFILNKELNTKGTKKGTKLLSAILQRRQFDR